MNHDEREFIATAINFFWGKNTASPHEVNEQAAKVVYEALEETQSCSASMDLVPRPSSGKPGLAYIIKQIAKVGKSLSEGDTSPYEACRLQVARNYRSELQLALMGL